MRKKTIIFSVIGLVVIAGGIYGYKEYTRGQVDLENVKPQVTISAADLIKEFETNEEAANKKYLPKEEFIIEVNGDIREVKKDDGGKYTVVLKGAEGTMSSVQCAVDSTHNKEVTTLQPGTPVHIKGVVTGFNADELVGSDVFLARSVVAQH